MEVLPKVSRYELISLNIDQIPRASKPNFLAIKKEVIKVKIVTRISDLKTLKVSNAASEVAKNPMVRAKLLEFQRSFASQPGGAVLDGRDIGTVICPNADIKFFISASAEIRARRRYEELLGLGHSISLDKVLKDIQKEMNEILIVKSPLWYQLWTQKKLILLI